MTTKPTQETLRSRDFEVAELRQRLREAEETIEAIRSGAVDALVVSGNKGDQVFTLKGAEKPYRLLMEAMSEGALTLLLDGTILYCNARFAEMVNAPTARVIGGSLFHYIERADEAALKTLLKKTSAAGCKAEFSLRPSGKSAALPVQLSFSRVEIDGLDAVALVATDISARREHERALKGQNEELERRVAERTADLLQANQALKLAQAKLSKDARDLEHEVAERTAALQESVDSLEQFCYTIAHDLRAPLRTMHGFSSALLEDFSKSLNDTGRDYARRIVSAATRMDDQIRALLAYGRLNSAEMPLVATDPGAMLEQLLHTDECRQARIDVQQPLPKVRANPTALKQVLENLLGNALKFVRPGTTPEVRISAQRQGEWVRLSIEDNGIGIDPKYHQRIFRVFERVSGNSVPGTGIGLAIVQKGVERMGGRVGVDSTPGKGSRFWVDLRHAE
jgi:PAS domain S-box-containing protein